MHSPASASPATSRPDTRSPTEARFHVVILAPSDSVYSACFGELAQSLAYGIQALGYHCSADLNRFEDVAFNIVLNAHRLPVDSQAVPPGCIIYNSEPLERGADYHTSLLCNLEPGCRIWDYSSQNLLFWRAHGQPNARHLLPGYVPQLSRIAKAEEQDIDVLFYGCMNERRFKVIDALGRAGLAVNVGFNVWGKQRDELIARSKLVLNLHYNDCQIFETVRVSYLLANRKAVVSEIGPGTEVDPRYAAAVEGVPYEGLVDACQALLADDERRRAREEQGYSIMQSMPASALLKPLIDELLASEARLALA